VCQWARRQVFDQNYDLVRQGHWVHWWSGKQKAAHLVQIAEGAWAGQDGGRSVANCLVPCLEPVPDCQLAWDAKELAGVSAHWSWQRWALRQPVARRVVRDEQLAVVHQKQGERQGVARLVQWDALGVRMVGVVWEQTSGRRV
jgi:hypothetical protein